MGAIGRSVLVLSIAAAMAALPAVGLAENLSGDRPTLKVGDQWKYERRDGFNKLEFSEETTVTSVSPENIGLSINGAPGRMTPDLKLLDGPRYSSDPGYQLLSFPLEVGKKWAFNTKYAIKRNSATGRAKFDVEVKGMETIKVAAGEFQAYKLEANGYLNYDSGGGSSPTATYWYAPKAKAIVRFSWVDRRNDYVQDLVQLKLAE